MNDSQDDAPEYLGPSKSQLKREMHQLQDLGRRMLDLSNDQLNTLPISDTLTSRLLMKKGFCVRAMTDFRFPGWIRISFAKMPVMKSFVDALTEVLHARGVL